MSTPTYSTEAQAQTVADALNARNIAAGEPRRWIVAKRGTPAARTWIVRRAALGYVNGDVCATVTTDARPECHAPTGVRREDYSGKNGSRAKRDGMVFDYWCAMGVAYADAVTGDWFAQDVVNGGTEFLPWSDGSGDPETGNYSPTRVVFSHVRSAENDGAACGCGMLPESAASNTMRGGANIAADDLPPMAVRLLEEWPAYWMSLSRAAGGPTGEARKRLAI